MVLYFGKRSDQESKQPKNDSQRGYAGAVSISVSLSCRSSLVSGTAEISVGCDGKLPLSSLRVFCTDECPYFTEMQGGTAEILIFVPHGMKVFIFFAHYIQEETK